MKLKHVSLAASALCAGALHGQFTLTILHVNDTESQLLHAGTPSADISAIPTSAAADLQNYGGSSRFIALIDQLRDSAETDAVLTVNAGDPYLPGIELDASNPTRNAANPEGVHFDALLFAAGKFDVSTIGNHEWDVGPEYFQAWLAKVEQGSDGIPGITIPFVSANLDLSAYPEIDSRVTPSVVIEKGGERIGVIGGTTPLLPGISSIGNVVMMDADGDGDSDLDDLASLVQDEVDALTADGVDKIILVTHLQSIRNEQELVTKIRGVDVVIAGGGHELLSNPGNPVIPGTVPFGPYPLLNDAQGQPVLDLDGKNVPIITANSDQRYVGRAVVMFDAAGEVTAFNGNPVLVTAFGQDAIEPNTVVHGEIVEPVYAFVGVLDNTVIASSEVPLDGRRSAIRNVETNLGNLVADAMLHSGQSQAGQFASEYASPSVSIQNGGGIRNDSILAAGDLTLGTLNAVLPFTNYISIVPEVPPARLKEIAEHAIATAGDSGGQFGQIAGMKIVYDIRGTAQVSAANGSSVTTPGNRVRSLVLDDGSVIVEDGEVVPGAPSVTIATINFLAAGGDNYPFYGLQQIDTPMLYQDALRVYVEEVLEGSITAEDYPEAGERRIFNVSNEQLFSATVFDGDWSLSPWFGYYFVSFYPFVWWPVSGTYLWIEQSSTPQHIWAYSYEDDDSSWVYLSPSYGTWIWYADARGAFDGWVNTAAD